MIKDQVAAELCKLEERKKVRRNQEVIDEKIKEKRKRERDERDSLAMLTQ